MAESQAAPPSAAAAAEQDVLLATKLYLPRLQPGFVARPACWTSSARRWAGT